MRRKKKNLIIYSYYFIFCFSEIFNYVTYFEDGPFSSITRIKKIKSESRFKKYPCIKSETFDLFNKIQNLLEECLEIKMEKVKNLQGEKLLFLYTREWKLFKKSTLHLRGAFVSSENNYGLNVYKLIVNVWYKTVFMKLYKHVCLDFYCC